jgi:hypothetical protein
VEKSLTLLAEIWARQYIMGDRLSARRRLSQRAANDQGTRLKARCTG